MSFVSRNHPQQVGTRGALDEVDDRGTTWEHFNEFNRRYGPFTLDVAAAPHNAKCADYYTRADDGLSQPWNGVIWCNPPYSDIGAWVRKAHDEIGLNAKRIVMLLPANRCEQKWWQEWVEPYREWQVRTHFLPGRMRFDRPGVEISPKGDRPPFGCVLLVWG